VRQLLILCGTLAARLFLFMGIMIISPAHYARTVPGIFFCFFHQVVNSNMVVTLNNQVYTFSLLTVQTSCGFDLQTADKLYIGNNVNMTYANLWKGC
jgi:hypothetical protein